MLAAEFITAVTIIMAADAGTNVAIVLACITLVGTLGAHVVAWHKVKTESANVKTQQHLDREKSNVEVAQMVLSQTVTTLNERLQIEASLNKERMSAMQEQHDRQIQAMKNQHEQEILELKEDHARDMKRLEAKIDRLTEKNAKCTDEINKLKGLGD